MELNKCEFRNGLTTCRISKKFSTEKLSESKYSRMDHIKICGTLPLKNFFWSILEYFVPCDIQNSIIQSSKSNSDAFDHWKVHTDCYCEYTRPMKNCSINSQEKKSDRY